MDTYYVDMKVEKKKEKTESIFLGYILSYLLKLITRVLLHFFPPLSLLFALGPCHVNVSWAYVISGGINSPPMRICKMYSTRQIMS
jgi:hypothetical protein